MPLTVKHLFSSVKADGADATLVRPSNWNADHVVTGMMNNAGAEFLFAGNVPLTGVTFAQGPITTCTGGVNQTLYTNASANRCVVGATYQNLSTSISADFTLYKSNGTLTMPVRVIPDVGIFGSGSAGFFPLDPGESIIVNVASGSLIFTASIMLYSPTSPMKAPAKWGMAAGNNILYTVPAGVTALLMRYSNTTLPFSNSGNLGIVGDLSASGVYTLTAGGVTLVTTTLAALQFGTYTMPPLFSAGTVLAINASVSAPGACISMPLIWERPN